jgi:hypothetical protein
MIKRDSALYTGFLSATTRIAVVAITTAKYPKNTCDTSALSSLSYSAEAGVNRLAV